MIDQGLLSKKIAYPIFSFAGFLFLFCLQTGSLLQKDGNIVWTGSVTVKIMLCSLIFGILLGSIAAALCYRLAAKGTGWMLRGEKTGKPGLLNVSESIPEWAVFLLLAGLIFLAWLPYFLAYYPGICAYDAVTQIGQIETSEYVEHHPLAHTLWIRACLALGHGIFRDGNAGVAIYTLVQMLVLAGALAYGVLVLRRLQVKQWILGLCLAVSMFYPFNGYLSVSMTKDILFSAMFLWQVLALFQILAQAKAAVTKTESSLAEKKLRPGRLDFLYMLSTLGMILFRNNGQYALLVLIVFLGLGLIFQKASHRLEKTKETAGKGFFRSFDAVGKILGRVLIESIAILLLGHLCLTGLSLSVHAVQGDKREMLSMPIQQLSRTMVYHGGEGLNPADDGQMTEEDKAFIRELFRENGYVNYNPYISDPVKNTTLTSVIRYQPMRFAKCYLHLLTQFPGDFVNAALSVNAGYLYPDDESHAHIYQVMYPGMFGKGYVQTQWWESLTENQGVKKASKWPALFERMEQWADENTYLKLPIVKYIFVPGVWLWVSILAVCMLILRKDFMLCLPYGLLLGYMITLLLGPTVQLRYIYPMMLCVPFLILGAGAATEGRKRVSDH